MVDDHLGRHRIPGRVVGHRRRQPVSIAVVHAERGGDEHGVVKLLVGRACLAGRVDIQGADVLAAPLDGGDPQQRPQLGVDWRAVRIRPYLVDQRHAARQLGDGECACEFVQ